MCAGVREQCSEGRTPKQSSHGNVDMKSTVNHPRR